MNVPVTARITSYPVDLAFRSADEITSAIAIKEVQPLVKDNLQKYATINVKDTMNNLMRVGDLLKLAIAASNNFTCNTPIIDVMVNYQVLIGNSFIACSRFTEAALKALQKHKLAIQLVQKGFLDKSIEVITSTSAIAKAMADGCTELIDQAEKLRDNSQKALRQATDDKAVTDTQRKDIEKMLGDLKVQQEVSKKRSDDLSKQLEDARSKEKDFENQLKDQRDKAFTIGIISAVMQPLAQMASAYTGAKAASASGGASTVLDQQAAKVKQEKEEEAKKADVELKEVKKEVDDKQKEVDAQKDEEKKAALEKELQDLKAKQKIKEEAVAQMSDKLDKLAQQCSDQAASISESLNQAMKIRVDLQKQMLDENSKLVESIEKLKNSQEQKNELAKAMASLELVVKTMGKVVTVFENTRLFWTAVQDDCKSIAELLDKDGDIQYVALLGSDAVMDKVYESGLRWLALGYVNISARDAMAKVKVLKVDEIMNNLPNGNEALDIVKTLTQQLSDDLSKEAILLSDGHSAQ